MSSISEIYKKNEETFYNYNSGNPIGTRRRKIGSILAALLLSFVFFDFTSDFVNGIITVYSILAGFGLNILFFLMGDGVSLSVPDGCTIEKSLRIKKVNKLSKELFHNVSYFIVLCIILVLMCLVYYVAYSANRWVLKSMYGVVDFLNPFNFQLPINFKAIRLFFTYMYNSAVIFFLLESLYSFCRTVFRVTFYFDRRLSLQGEGLP